MKWKHLEEPEMMGRLLVAAGFVARRVQGKVILDLNCGQTPLFPFLPGMFRKYVGNANDARAISFLKKAYPRGVWLQCADSDLPDLVRVDVLLCLGWEVGRDTESWTEDSVQGEGEVVTLGETVMGLVYQHYPEVVVLETWSRTPKLDDFNRLVEWLVDQGYREVGRWVIMPWQQISRIMAKRGLVLLEKSEGRRRKK